MEEYKIYKRILSMKEYFKNWTPEKYNSLTADLKNQIYQKYVVKAQVFQRDNYKCQNIKCSTPDNPLTLHHVKFQKNGGEDKVKNGVTVCDACHRAYHRAKKPLVFPNRDKLPAHIRGHTFKLEKPDKINWKQVKGEMRKFRRSLRSECGIRLSWEHIAILMKFLYLEFDE